MDITDLADVTWVNIYLAQTGTDERQRNDCKQVNSDESISLSVLVTET